MGRNRGFGERVKQAREYLGLKRRSLARRLGISPEMLEMLETGQIDQTDFGQDKLDRIADTLNRPLHFFVTGEIRSQACARHLLHRVLLWKLGRSSSDRSVGSISSRTSDLANMSSLLSIIRIFVASH